ncbi:hypothetical protein F2Q70_00002760 [Brassica cretica]|uniref:Uncharacterized protein n=1 Tax=Brassica cretica TaxID=69181 RepID=A0A8S9ISU1_BRACR|nr:hypothetical protein F2Q70_00002760 [Brassica cretica]
MRHCPHGGDWSELAESLMEKPGTQDFSLHFWRLSGSMNRVEECMGQDPRILRGRFFARLRISWMRRFNKTRRMKLRILMLDYTSLTCASWACKSSSCLVSGLYLDFWQGGRSACSSWLTLGTGVEFLDMLFADPGHVFPGSEDLEIHPSETHGSWRLDGLSSSNSEAGWTLVLEPGGCRTRRSCGNPEVLLLIRRSYLDPEVMWEPGGSPFDPEIVTGPGGNVGTQKFFFRS